MTHEESAPAAEWAIRPFRDDDVLGIVSLINAVFDAYHLGEGVAEDDLRNDLSVPGSDATDFWHLAGVLLVMATISGTLLRWAKHQGWW